MAAHRVPSTLCPKKWITQLMVITLSKPNRFSKFFHPRKKEQIVKKLIRGILPHLKYVAALYLWKVEVQICGKLRTRWTFSRAFIVSVGISKLGLCIGLHVCPYGGEDQRRVLPSYHSQLGGPLFGTQCSFVDEIKLNYSLTNPSVCSCCHIRLCTLYSLSKNV